ncbi:hypothetical protein D3C85_1718720 [compost metagenome]
MPVARILARRTDRLIGSAAPRLPVVAATAAAPVRWRLDNGPALSVVRWSA